jgi:hypothetical protein
MRKGWRGKYLNLNRGSNRKIGKNCTVKGFTMASPDISEMNSASM